jgi:hypothetical protein
MFGSLPRALTLTVEGRELTCSNVFFGGNASSFSSAAHLRPSHRSGHRRGGPAA